MCDSYEEDMDCSPVEEDTGSVISERCWEEKYRGDSRKWLVRDGSTKKSRGEISSCTRESFQMPENDERPFIGNFKRSFL